MSEDEGYRQAWHSSIAATIQDAFKEKGIQGKIVYDSSQLAAEMFLDSFVSRYGK